MKKIWKKEEIEQTEPAHQEQPEEKKPFFSKKKPEKEERLRSQEKAKKQKKEKLTKKAKPSKSQEYIIKKNFTMKVLRGIFWIMISFIFFKGIMVSLRQDQTLQVQSIIRSFRSELALEKDKNEEIFGFTQNFIKEYLSYSKEGGEKDFKSRISTYVSKQFNTANAYDFRKDAKATYVQAYRKEQYSSSQYDVFVLAEIMYTDKVLNEQSGEYEVVTEYETSILKVPVSVSVDNKYCVEGIPMFVKDDLLDYGYTVTNFYPEGKIDNARVQSSIENFLTAYYSQDQEIINYYLTVDADKTKFLSLNSRYVFEKIEDIKAFQSASGIICVLQIRIKDSVNGAVIHQEFNLTCIEENDRVYIEDINTRVNNIKQ